MFDSSFLSFLGFWFGFGPGWLDFLPHALFALHYPSATYVLLFYGLPRPHPLFWRPLWP